MSNATVEVFKPDTGDKYTIPAGELAEAKAKGYAPVPASAAPLSTAVASPAANPVPLPADTHPNVSDADLTPDGHIRAFSQEGKEVHVVDEPGAIQTLRDKGYVLASDRALDAQTQARQQAADEERKAKLGIEGYDPEALKEDYAQRGVLGLGLPPALDLMAAGIAAPNQEAADAIRNRLPGGRTPEQQAAVEAAREGEISSYGTLGKVAYWAGRVPSEIVNVVGLAKAATAATRGLTGAARLVAEGSIFGVPDATAKILNGDPEGAAESMAAMVVGNAALHGIFSLGAKVLGRTAQASAEAAERAGADVELQAGKKVISDAISPAFADRIGEETRPLLEKAGISEAEASDPKKLLEVANDIKESDPNVKAAYEGLAKADRGELTEALGKADADLIMLPEHPGIDAIREKIAGVKGWEDVRDLKSWLHEYKPPTVGTPEGLEGVDFMRATDDAKDAVHSAILEAQQDLVGRLGESAGAKVLDGLQKEGAVTALRKLFGGLEDVPARPETPGLMASAMKALRGRRAGAALAAGWIAHAALGVHVGAPAVIVANLARDALAAGAEKKGFARAMKGALRMARPNAAVAVDAIKQVDDRIAGRVDALMTDLKSGKTTKHKIEPVLSSFLPNAGAGLSRAMQVTVLRRAVAQQQTAPEAVADHLGAMTMPLHEEGLQPVAAAFAQHQMNLLKVVQAALGPDPMAGAMHPFQSPREDKPDPAQEARIDRTLAIAADPTVLLDLVRSNTITDTDVAIAEYTNPATLQKIRIKAAEAGAKGKLDLSYQKEIGMNRLMGGSSSARSKSSIAMLQSTFASAGANAPVGPRQGVENKGMNAKGQDHFLESSLTTSQRSIVGPR